LSFAYFDTSAAVKRYVEERGALQVRRLLRRYDFLSSTITPLEVVSALCRRRIDGDLTDTQFLACSRRLQTDRARWELIEPGTTVFNRAEDILRGGARLRTLDAIHLGSLTASQAAFGSRIPLVTADARQRDAAERLRLEVLWVG
jgi:predicted nucleic acid-binding protein